MDAKEKEQWKEAAKGTSAEARRRAQRILVEFDRFLKEQDAQDRRFVASWLATEKEILDKQKGVE